MQKHCLEKQCLERDEFVPEENKCETVSISRPKKTFLTPFIYQTWLTEEFFESTG